MEIEQVRNIKWRKGEVLNRVAYLSVIIHDVKVSVTINDTKLGTINLDTDLGTIYGVEVLSCSGGHKR